MIFHGGVPLKTSVKLVEDPEQMVLFPLSIPVGKVFILTWAPPDIVPGQKASLTAVREYVLLDVGDTLIVLKLVAIPVIVTGVVPSV